MLRNTQLVAFLLTILLSAIVSPATTQGPVPQAPAETRTGSKVTGRVEGLPGGLPEGSVHIALQPWSLPTLLAEAEVAPNGAFAFDNVSPGQYKLRLMGFMGAQLSSDRFVEVAADKNIETIVRRDLPFIFGKVLIDDGGPLPAETGAARGNPDALALARVATSGGGWPEQSTVVRADGSFVLSMPTAAVERAITIAELPVGYSVKSISYGTADLLQMPLRADAGRAVEELRIVLSATPAPGVTVSGRVVGVPVSASTVVTLRRIPNSAPGFLESQEGPIGVAEMLPREDGTFEFHRVPPGTYTAVLLSGVASAVVRVSDRDVVGLELAPVPPEPESMRYLEDSARKPLEIPLQTLIGPDKADCGAFYGSPMRRPVIPMDTVIECARAAMNRGQAFVVVTVTSGVDSISVTGFAGDTARRIHRFSGCDGGPPSSLIGTLPGYRPSALIRLNGEPIAQTGCGPFQSQPCPLFSTLAVKRGELVCAPPPSSVIRWPAPKSVEGGR